VKIESLAKKNPTFELVSPSLNCVDSPFDSERFAMIDEELVDDDLLVDELIPNDTNKCDTQVGILHCLLIL